MYIPAALQCYQQAVDRALRESSPLDLLRPVELELRLRQSFKDTQRLVEGGNSGGFLSSKNHNCSSQSQRRWCLILSEDEVSIVDIVSYAGRAPQSNTAAAICFCRAAASS